MKTQFFWRFVYRVYPPILRILEKLRFHSGRQPWRVGFLKKGVSVKKVREVLKSKGYEDCILTWKDVGEILNMRLIHKKKFQFHIRIFNDGEVRGHYEYASEGNPLHHVFENGFKQERKYFIELMGVFLR